MTGIVQFAMLLTRLPIPETAAIITISTIKHTMNSAKLVHWNSRGIS